MDHLYIYLPNNQNRAKNKKKEIILDSVIFAGLLIILGGVSIASQAGTK